MGESALPVRALASAAGCLDDQKMIDQALRVDALEKKRTAPACSIA